jgi:UDP-N-acetylglucosamine--N-acetylmuramyl-(pentapeptide) pyrophosphoryl-undecaprenol N-acetylglucosamine transferase
MSSVGNHLNVTLACGGTGGHLFPGLAVAEQLPRRGVDITLMVSAKEVDQTAAKTATGMKIVTLPAVGLTGWRVISFLRGFIHSYRTALDWFSQHPPQAALAMGGFTSAPPILAARRFKAATFLHESNSVPGRANRWLSWVVNEAFVGFPSAAKRLHNRHVTITGTPVRAKFQPREVTACRSALGLDPSRPVALVMGGSQGARGINELVIKSLPLFASCGPDWQWFHLAGPGDLSRLREAYDASGLRSTIHSFFVDMELAMGAATACISRAGASSLAEIAAMRLPSVLVPYPTATDDHQRQNADAFCVSGAARMLNQLAAGPKDLVETFGGLMCNDSERERMRDALAKWHTPKAAEEIAQAILETVGRCVQPSVNSAAHREPPPKDVRIDHGSELVKIGSNYGIKLSRSHHESSPFSYMKRRAA